MLDSVVSKADGSAINLALAGSNVKVDFGVSQTFSYWDVRYYNYTFEFDENVEIVYDAVSFGSVNTTGANASKNLTFVGFSDSNSIFINAKSATTPLDFKLTDDNILTISGDCAESDYGTASYVFKTDDNIDLKITEVFEGEKLLGFKITTASVAVPEPTEWAMALGGIALGLAIYRRRK